jgi:uncharacterized beta-barrel protein YwiB (DUF1934 family)
MQAEPKPILVKLVTEIHDQGRKETVTQQAEGSLYLNETSTTITYKEENEQVGDIKTIIKVKENETLVMRSGAVGMRQNFQRGKTTLGEYKSTAGVMQMRTQTENMSYEYKQKAKKGKFTLAYRLNLQGEDVGRHRLTLTFKEV